MTFARELSQIAAAVTVDTSKNVGIKTSSPDAALSVNGAASFADGTASAPAITNIGDLNTGIFFPAADTIAFSEGGVESMRIDSAGNVGIGTSGASERLTIRNTDGRVSIFLASGTTNQGYIGYFDSTQTLSFGNGNPTGTGANGGQQLNITSSGNVGIGTSSPATKLQAVGTISSISGSVTASMQSDGSNGIFEVNGACFLRSTNSNPLILGTNNTERMRIDSSGSVLINRAATYYGSALSMNFTPASQIGLTFYPQGSTYGNGGIIFTNLALDIVGGIYSNATATSYGTTSDYRLKENVAPMTGALATVAQLKPVTYNWKTDGSDGQGFIAHELQEVVPDAVTGEKDAIDEKGKPKYQSIDTSFLVATLTAAIQEQQTMIEELKAKVAALEAA
jgi:hypothetical protein